MDRRSSRVDPIRVLVADDDESIRHALVQIIERTDGIDVIGEATDADEAIRIASLRHPDVALIDVRMPSGGGPRAAREIRWRSPTTSLVALSALQDPSSVEEMLAGGATSYLVKDAPIDDILEAIHRATLGDDTLSVPIARHVVKELGVRLQRDREQAEEMHALRGRIEHVLNDDDCLRMQYQPIAQLSPERIVGFEALARFSLEPQQAPDRWFEEAAHVGLGTKLQILAIQKALPTLEELPDDMFLSVNVDPDTLASPMFVQALGDWPRDRIVLELTEHAPAGDYETLLEALNHLRRFGVRLAVDDAGAGFASLRHILKLSPDIIKLDVSISRDVDKEPAKRALASSLSGFARQTGTVLAAEGVETEAEIKTLADLGVPWVQGYLIGRPEPHPARFDFRIPAAVQPSHGAADPAPPR